ncbi:hypothetical protein [Novosphingobium rosa]|nr:hypothetical protein [Novosphingobium rosa]
MRLSHELGALVAGQRADFVWLDAALNAVQTWIGGRPVSAERIAA